VGIVAALLVLAAAALCGVVALAALARLLDEESWRFQRRWARRPRFAAAIERFAFFRLNALQAFILWVVLTAIAVAFFALPALFYLFAKAF